MSRYAFVEPWHLGHILNGGQHLRFVVRVRAEVSGADCAAGSDAAKRLRQSFQAAAGWQRATKLCWAARWPGTSGQRALMFDVPADVFAVRTLGDLVTSPGGSWNDAQYVTEGGVVALAVSSRRIVALREDLLGGMSHGQLAEEPQPETVPLDDGVERFLRSPPI